MLKELLEVAYPTDEVNYLLEEIEKLKKEYSAKLDLRPEPLSEKDVVLIAYGDQVTFSDEHPLITLKRFMDRYAKGLINTIHVLPFYPYTSDDGFSVTDYYAVNPRLGGWSDIKSMAQDYKMMFDAVINHVSKESGWFKKYLAGDPEYANYFIEVDPTRDWSTVVRPRTSPLFHPFKDAQGNVKSIWTTFSEDQVDINYRNPKVFLHILDVLLYYIQQGAVLLRLDAIGFMQKKEKTKSIHLPQTHALIKVMRKVIEELAPDVLLITETNVPHEENISYFGSGGDEAHMVYNFTLPPLLTYSILTGNTEVITQWARTLKLPGRSACFFNFTASHDGIGVRPLDGILPQEEWSVLIEAAEVNGGLVSYRTGPDGNKSPYEINCNYMSLLYGKERDADLAVKRMILAQAVKVTMPGVPAIYFHSLVGSLNYNEGAKQTGMNRTINREKLDFEKLSEELDAKNGRRRVVYEALCQLLDTRQKHRAFHPYGGFSFPKFDYGIFAIERIFDDQKLLCIYNFTNESKALNLDNGTYKDLLSGKVYGDEVPIDPYKFVWLECV